MALLSRPLSAWKGGRLSRPNAKSFVLVLSQYYNWTDYERIRRDFAVDAQRLGESPALRKARALFEDHIFKMSLTDFLRSDIFQGHRCHPEPVVPLYRRRPSSERAARRAVGERHARPGSILRFRRSDGTLRSWHTCTWRAPGVASGDGGGHARTVQERQPTAAGGGLYGVTRGIRVIGAAMRARSAVVPIRRGSIPGAPS